MKRFAALLCCFVVTIVTGTIAAAGPTAQEAAKDYQDYQSERANLADVNSPAGRLVAGIAARLEPVVQRLYGAPFHYYLTREPDPNAYSYYSSRVYISEGMIGFAENREEIAGVLCHESAHVLHHDGTRSELETHAHNVRVDELAVHHATFAHLLAIGSNLVQLHFSQGQELAADRTGAVICNQAGFNPWGMVWMLQHMQHEAQYRTSRLGAYRTDHPSNQKRISALIRLLRTPQFSTWSSDERFATQK